MSDSPHPEAVPAAMMTDTRSSPPPPSTAQPRYPALALDAETVARQARPPDAVLRTPSASRRPSEGTCGSPPFSPSDLASGAYVCRVCGVPMEIAEARADRRAAWEQHCHSALHQRRLLEDATRSSPSRRGAYPHTSNTIVHTTTPKRDERDDVKEGAEGGRAPETQRAALAQNLPWLSPQRLAPAEAAEAADASARPPRAAPLPAPEPSPSKDEDEAPPLTQTPAVPLTIPTTPSTPTSQQTRERERQLNDWLYRKESARLRACFHRWYAAMFVERTAPLEDDSKPTSAQPSPSQAAPSVPVSPPLRRYPSSARATTSPPPQSPPAAQRRLDLHGTSRGGSGESSSSPDHEAETRGATTAEAAPAPPAPSVRAVASPPRTVEPDADAHKGEPDCRTQTRPSSSGPLLATPDRARSQTQQPTRRSSSSSASDPAAAVVAAPRSDVLMIHTRAQEYIAMPADPSNPQSPSRDVEVSRVEVAWRVTLRPSSAHASLTEDPDARKSKTKRLTTHRSASVPDKKTTEAPLSTPAGVTATDDKKAKKQRRRRHGRKTALSTSPPSSPRTPPPPHTADARGTESLSATEGDSDSDVAVYEEEASEYPPDSSFTTNTAQNSDDEYDDDGHDDEDDAGHHDDGDEEIPSGTPGAAGLFTRPRRTRRHARHTAAQTPPAPTTAAPQAHPSSPSDSAASSLSSSLSASAVLEDRTEAIPIARPNASYRPIAGHSVAPPSSSAQDATEQVPVPVRATTPTHRSAQDEADQTPSPRPRRRRVRSRRGRRGGPYADEDPEKDVEYAPATSTPTDTAVAANPTSAPPLSSLAQVAADATPASAPKTASSPEAGSPDKMSPPSSIRPSTTDASSPSMPSTEKDATSVRGASAPSGKSADDTAHASTRSPRQRSRHRGRRGRGGDRSEDSTQDRAVHTPPSSSALVHADHSTDDHDVPTVPTAQPADADPVANPRTRRRVRGKGRGKRHRDEHGKGEDDDAVDDRTPPPQAGHQSMPHPPQTRSPVAAVHHTTSDDESPNAEDKEDAAVQPRTGHRSRRDSAHAPYGLGRRPSIEAPTEDAVHRAGAAVSTQHEPFEDTDEDQWTPVDATPAVTAGTEPSGASPTAQGPFEAAPPTMEQVHTEKAETEGQAPPAHTSTPTSSLSPLSAPQGHWPATTDSPDKASTRAVHHDVPETAPLAHTEAADQLGTAPHEPLPQALYSPLPHHLPPRRRRRVRHPITGEWMPAPTEAPSAQELTDLAASDAENWAASSPVLSPCSSSARTSPASASLRASGRETQAPAPTEAPVLHHPVPGMPPSEATRRAPADVESRTGAASLPAWVVPDNAVHTDQHIVRPSRLTEPFTPATSTSLLRLSPPLQPQPQQPAAAVSSTLSSPARRHAPTQTRVPGRTAATTPPRRPSSTPETAIAGVRSGRSPLPHLRSAERRLAPRPSRRSLSTHSDLFPLSSSRLDRIQQDAAEELAYSASHSSVPIWHETAASSFSVPFVICSGESSVTDFTTAPTTTASDRAPPGPGPLIEDDVAEAPEQVEEVAQVVEIADTPVSARLAAVAPAWNRPLVAPEQIIPQPNAPAAHPYNAASARPAPSATRTGTRSAPDGSERGPRQPSSTHPLTRAVTRTPTRTAPARYLVAYPRLGATDATSRAPSAHRPSTRRSRRTDSDSDSDRLRLRRFNSADASDLARGLVGHTPRSSPSADAARAGIPKHPYNLPVCSSASSSADTSQDGSADRSASDGGADRLPAHPADVEALERHVKAVEAAEEEEAAATRHAGNDLLAPASGALAFDGAVGAETDSQPADPPTDLTAMTALTNDAMASEAVAGKEDAEEDLIAPETGSARDAATAAASPEVVKATSPSSDVSPVKTGAGAGAGAGAGGVRPSAHSAFSPPLPPTSPPPDACLAAQTPFEEPTQSASSRSRSGHDDDVDADNRDKAMRGSAPGSSWDRAPDARHPTRATRRENGDNGNDSDEDDDVRDEEMSASLSEVSSQAGLAGDSGTGTPHLHRSPPRSPRPDWFAAKACDMPLFLPVMGDGSVSTPRRLATGHRRCSPRPLTPLRAPTPLTEGTTPRLVQTPTQASAAATAQPEADGLGLPERSHLSFSQPAASALPLSTEEPPRTPRPPLPTGTPLHHRMDHSPTRGPRDDNEDGAVAEDGSPSAVVDPAVPSGARLSPTRRLMDAATSATPPNRAPVCADAAVSPIPSVVVSAAPQPAETPREDARQTAVQPSPDCGPAPELRPTPPHAEEAATGSSPSYEGQHHHHHSPGQPQTPCRARESDVDPRTHASSTSRPPLSRPSGAALSKTSASSLSSMPSTPSSSPAPVSAAGAAAGRDGPRCPPQQAPLLREARSPAYAPSAEATAASPNRSSSHPRSTSAPMTNLMTAAGATPHASRSRISPEEEQSGADSASAESSVLESSHSHQPHSSHSHSSSSERAPSPLPSQSASSRAAHALPPRKSSFPPRGPLAQQAHADMAGPRLRGAAADDPAAATPLSPLLSSSPSSLSSPQPPAVPRPVTDAKAAIPSVHAPALHAPAAEMPRSSGGVVRLTVLAPDGTPILVGEVPDPRLGGYATPQPPRASQSVSPEGPCTHSVHGPEDHPRPIAAAPADSAVAAAHPTLDDSHDLPEPLAALAAGPPQYIIPRGGSRPSPHAQEGAGARGADSPGSTCDSDRLSSPREVEAARLVAEAEARDVVRRLAAFSADSSSSHSPSRPSLASLRRLSPLRSSRYASSELVPSGDSTPSAAMMNAEAARYPHSQDTRQPSTSEAKKKKVRQDDDPDVPLRTEHAPAARVPRPSRDRSTDGADTGHGAVAEEPTRRRRSRSSHPHGAPRSSADAHSSRRPITAKASEEEEDMPAMADQAAAAKLSGSEGGTPHPSPATTTPPLELTRAEPGTYYVAAEDGRIYRLHSLTPPPPAAGAAPQSGALTASAQPPNRRSPGPRAGAAGGVGGVGGRGVRSPSSHSSARHLSPYTGRDSEPYSCPPPRWRSPARLPLTVPQDPLGCARFNPYCSTCRAKYNKVYVDDATHEPVRFPSSRSPELRHLGECRYNRGLVFGGPAPLVPPVRDAQGGERLSPPRTRGQDAREAEKALSAAEPSGSFVPVRFHRRPSVEASAQDLPPTPNYPHGDDDKDARDNRLSPPSSWPPVRTHPSYASPAEPWPRATTDDAPYTAPPPSWLPPPSRPPPTAPADVTRAPSSNTDSAVHAAQPSHTAGAAEPSEASVAPSATESLRSLRREERRLRKCMKQLLWHDLPDMRDGEQWELYLESLTYGLDRMSDLRHKRKLGDN